MALLLEVGKLLAMEKNNCGFHPITIGEMFFGLINHFVVL
jgi:hypothetical protein